jgi:putative RNA 2'-phosphotransferase
MDQAGWVPITEVLDALSMSRDDLNRAVEMNDKARLQVNDDDLIRACQGHSLEGMPVTLDGLEASWDVVSQTRRSDEPTSTWRPKSTARSESDR